MLWLGLLACPQPGSALTDAPWRSAALQDYPAAELATALDADGQTDWIRAVPCGQPDGSLGFCVRVAVSQTRTTQTIYLGSDIKSVRIASHDVDGDELPDVLVMAGKEGSPLGVWINDGHGGFKRSDPNLYPKSVWHEDPLFCSPPSPPEGNSLASLSGVQFLGLEPSSLNEPLLAASPSFRIGQVPDHRAPLRGVPFGRAPPLT